MRSEEPVMEHLDRGGITKMHRIINLMPLSHQVMHGPGPITPRPFACIFTVCVQAFIKSIAYL